ncbi:nuclear transport factor 2 family protein [Kitasatospora sp. NBC_01287]|uniref:nuclear transport factor 2 family protein n=1 Tax=Kitasatospora sp. NBC_01287 TaxID=2903573 RepID=UPI00224FF513|nr:nuclear transport factor 2 family protein [Kitasatospora sp. NBC_01287]MCX4750233.1 nuclear transport factor 2 family protein [Kitasatospora sp. NBC_01287]
MTHGAQEQGAQDLRDRLDVIELCTKFGWLFDQRDWAALAEVFADQVVTGSPDEPRTLTPRQLVDTWAAQVAGVRSTQHQITDHLVALNSAAGTASCTAQYQVRHTGTAAGRDPRLENAGHYRFDLRATPAGWRITRLVATPTWSSGDPTILDAPPAGGSVADAGADAGAGAGAAREADAQSVARRFLAAISDQDLPTAFDCLAEDVVMDMPFAPPGSPLRLNGADAVRRLYAGVVTAVQSIELPVLRTEAFADRRWALVEYTGKMVQPNGSDYTNHYYGMFQVVDGKIKVLRELYDTYRYAAQVSAEDRRAMFQAAEGQA